MFIKDTVLPYLTFFWATLLALGVILVYPALKHEAPIWGPVGFITTGLIALIVWIALMKRYRGFN